MACTKTWRNYRSVVEHHRRPSCSQALTGNLVYVLLKVVDGFTCMWCQVSSSTVQGLMYHLILDHDRCTYRGTVRFIFCIMQHSSVLRSLLPFVLLFCFSLVFFFPCLAVFFFFLFRFVINFALAHCRSFRSFLLACITGFCSLLYPAPPFATYFFLLSILSWLPSPSMPCHAQTHNCGPCCISELVAIHIATTLRFLVWEWACFTAASQR